MIILENAPMEMADDGREVGDKPSITKSELEIDEASAVEGGLISLTEDGVLGWAWNPRHPEVPVSVTISAEGRIIGASVADIVDNELIRHEVGAGRPGFIIKLKVAHRLSYPLALQLRDDSGRNLGNALMVNRPVELEGWLLHEDHIYEGYVDSIEEGYLIGWAWNPFTPDRAITVELFEGDERLDRTLAKLYRADLAVAGKGTGHCVFRFELPISLLDDRSHSLRVRVAGTNFFLPGKTIQFGPLAASGLFEELSSLRVEVKRLQNLVERVSSPSGDLQTMLVRSLSERVFAVMEVQRETVESELDAIRKIAFRHHKHELLPTLKRRNNVTNPKMVGGAKIGNISAS